MISTVLHRVVAQPAIYDGVQKLAGFETIGGKLAPHLALSAGRTLLDIGAGTGNYRRFMPPTTRYLWLDTDPQKLAGFQAKRLGGEATLCSGTDLCFRPGSLDYSFCSCVSHHLDDSQVDRLFSEVSRVTRRQFIFLEAVDCPERWVSNLLWRYDRGSYPRSSAQLQQTLGRYFDLQLVEEFSIHHRYLLCLATPKR